MEWVLALHRLVINVEQINPFSSIGNLKTAIPCQAEVALFIVFPNIF